MATTTLNPPNSSRAFWRWATFFFVVLLIAGSLLFIRITSFMDDPVRNGLSMLVVAASMLLLAGWFLFFGGSVWYLRLGIVLLGLGVIFGGLYVTFAYYVEIRGVTGDWWPTFALKGTPKRYDHLAVDPAVETPKVAPGTAGAMPGFPRFLGPDGMAHLSGIGLDPDWRNHPPRELWRREVGDAWSAFAVVNERAVTQEQHKDFELVTCYNLRDGALLWSHKDEGRFTEFQGGDGPRATPTIVGDRVFTMGALGQLNCLDLNTGKPVWGKNVLTDNNQDRKFVPVWAKSNSPLVYDQEIGKDTRQLVVVTLGENKDRTAKTIPSLAAYDAKTGDRVWVAGDDRCSYASPILTTLAGVRQVVSVNAISVTSHDPATGTILWTYDWPGFMAKCSQPVPLGDDRLLLSMGYSVGAQVIHVENKGGAWSSTQEWANNSLRTTFSNVVVYEGHAYGLDDGVLQCVALKDGAKKWRNGKYAKGQILGVDDLLLVQAEDGKVYLVAADPTQYRQLAELDALHSKTWTNPVLVGKYLLLRNAEEAVCYELPLKGK